MLFSTDFLQIHIILVYGQNFINFVKTIYNLSLFI